MSMTGENEVDLRKITDMTRIGSIIILILHFYYYCYATFYDWKVHAPITDRLLENCAKTGLFIHNMNSKLLAIGLLAVSLLSAQGKKDEKLTWPPILRIIFSGLILYFLSIIIFYLQLTSETITCLYILFTSVGYLLLLQGGTLLSRMVRINFADDIFNEINESFPQEERRISNEYSINLPSVYKLKGIARKSWINIINPFRGLLVVGSPGAGKSWFVIQHVIKQQIEKGFAMFIYDFKYDDLSLIAYNWLLRNHDKYKVVPSFYAISFDNLNQSSRCNPLDPFAMHDITDATESARTILMGLNREWIKKQGDFFVESAINFVTANIWFLRKFQDGKYCTLPHVIELMQTDYEELLPVLNTQPEVQVYINDFIKAFQDDAMEQLAGQVASAKVGIARLSSPQLYWVLSGSDFTLDINNPDEPKIVCLGNNPEKQEIYGAVLSLYVSRMIKIINKKGKLKCGINIDETPTIYLRQIDGLLATARSNKVATTLAIQDISQLRKDYGKEQADVIVNITGNIISGQVTGDTAKLLSERFGKIMQDRENISTNRNDTSISRSKQLDSAIPASKIAALSSGEFVGMMADDPEEKIKLKMFHAEIINDNKKLNEEMKHFKPIPEIREVTQQQIMDNFFQIKYDIKQLIDSEVDRLVAEKEAAEAASN